MNIFEQKERVEGYVQIQQANYVLKDHEFDMYAELIGSSQKGIIVCGQIDDQDFSKQVVELAEKLQFPILADPLSQSEVVIIMEI